MMGGNRIKSFDECDDARRVTIQSPVLEDHIAQLCMALM